MGKAFAACIAAVVAIHAVFLAAHLSWFAGNPKKPGFEIITFGISMQTLLAASIAARAVCAVVFLLWLSGADRRARQIRQDALPRPAWWTVASYAVPIINITEPIEVLKRIWITSHRTPGAAGAAARDARATPVYLEIWWLSFLFALLFEFLGMYLKTSSEQWITSASSHFCYILSGVIAAKIVFAIDRAQRDALHSLATPRVF